MNSRFLFIASAMLEILTGIALLLGPQLVTTLLLGDQSGTVGSAVARLLGAGLLALGIAAWEFPGRDIRLVPRTGLCIYNVGAAALLATFGAHDGMHGLLLWPAAILHALFGFAMLWTILAFAGIRN